nr:probable beta-D-xylosidase 6 [Quercus suber]POE44902.1 putative beta-d-xylosidase 6 [Quercus suber]
MFQKWPCNWNAIIITLIFLKLLTIFNPKSLFPSTSTAPSSHPFKSNPSFSCAPPHHSYPFCNTSLPIKTRAQSLISLLTLHEKIQLLSNNASAIHRLGLSAYEWWSESLHGIATNGPGVSLSGPIRAATSFPQVLLTTASFNKSLWFSVGRAIGFEGRAMYNEGQSGLTFWAPNINIFRDPRWGRGQETSGEDPMVASAYAVEYVKGLQGEDLVGGDGGFMVSACCKHYTAYDLENWGDFHKFSFNAMVSKQDMEDTYQPPFQSCIEEGGATCLMCSYNRVNGVPSCADPDLLQIARRDWGFKGYITSDCDAVAVIYEDHKYAKAPEDAVADVIKAGMDIDCGTYLSRYTQLALEQGQIQEEDINRALSSLFSVQLLLGLFNGDPSKGHFGKLGREDICTLAHKKLAIDAARQGIVLLKNDKNLLPLKRTTITSLAIIGPSANDSSQLGGDYTGVPCNPISLFEGLQPYIKTTYATGCGDTRCNSSDGFAEAVRISAEADAVVVVAGLDLSQEDEERDRTSLLLPGKQMDLISAVSSASESPIILILLGGGPIDVSFAKVNPQIGSVLWIGYPGEAGGQAVAEIIFGEFNPGGRLPVTWYPESFSSVPMNDMSLRPDPSRGYPGRTYRFYTGEVVYEFGYGLTYSNITYKFISVPDNITILNTTSKSGPSKLTTHKTLDGIDYIYVNEIASCNLLKFEVQISVFNHGDMDASHVIMLFGRASTSIRGAPRKTLIEFTRVHTESLNAVQVNIGIDPCKHFSIVNDDGVKILPLGNHLLMLERLEHSISIGL